VLPIDEPEDCKDPNNKEEFFPKPILTGSIYITTEKVDELWEKVKDKVKIISSIADREYWMRDFSIHDNNGYELVFGENNMPDLNNFFLELYKKHNLLRIIALIVLFAGAISSLVLMFNGRNQNSILLIVLSQAGYSHLFIGLFIADMISKLVEQTRLAIYLLIIFIALASFIFLQAP
jgi:hypothetical protein